MTYQLIIVHIRHIRHILITGLPMVYHGIPIRLRQQALDGCNDGINEACRQGGDLADLISFLPRNRYKKS
jgi:hypothetical protein